MKQICILFASLLMCTAAEAQNYASKLKKAKGIEVTYHSLYKGKVNPGSTVMKVFGDHVKLESVWPESKKTRKKKRRKRQSHDFRAVKAISTIAASAVIAVP